MVKMLLAAFVVPLCAVAGVVCALGPGAAGYKASADERPSPDTMQVASRVNLGMKAICADHCPQVAVFRNATAANAMLVLDGGKAKLVYSPPFFASAYAAYGDGSVIAVFAHELGHALDDTMGAAWVNQKWPPELRADSWAGCILGRMKLKDAELGPTISALAKYPSPAHPAWPRRLPAFRAGFGHCGGDAARFHNQP